MDMRMRLEVLSPGVEQAEKSDVGSEMLRIASQFEHRRGTGVIEKIVEQSLVLEDKCGQMRWQCEDHVEVRNGQQFSRARRESSCTRVSLALGAVPIAA
jgi:hypothetical protein